MQQLMFTSNLCSIFLYYFEKGPLVILWCFLGCIFQKWSTWLLSTETCGQPWSWFLHYLEGNKKTKLVISICLDSQLVLHWFSYTSNVQLYELWSVKRLNISYLPQRKEYKQHFITDVSIFLFNGIFRILQIFFRSKIYTLKHRFSSSVWAIISYNVEVATKNAGRMKSIIAHQMQMQNKSQTTQHE